MNYFKRNGVTTIVQVSEPSDSIKWEESNFYRDPVDIVTGTITMAQFFMISACRKKEKLKLARL